jgi:hypothetical protein
VCGFFIPKEQRDVRNKGCRTETAVLPPPWPSPNGRGKRRFSPHPPNQPQLMNGVTAVSNLVQENGILVM